MVPAEAMHAQTASSAEGVSPCRSWMLSRAEVEVRRGGSPRTRGRVSFAGVQSGVVVHYAEPSFSGYECLWEAGV